MLTVDEALTTLVEQVQPLETAFVPIEDALGLILASPIASDVDSPPFDKALMDGYAVRAESLSPGKTAWKVIEEVTAGHVPKNPIGPGEATRIMTGAPIPLGADAVVRSEDGEFHPESHTVTLATSGLVPGANVMRAGSSVIRGARLLEAGCTLYAQQLGALAEIGQYSVPVFPRPRIAVLATGDELVPVTQTPGPGQIRNSNETMLVAQICQAGAEPVPLGIVRDDREALHSRIQTGLKHDILVLSGGVSAGKLDLVPSELESAGVRRVFHKVHMKPGKPVWFGIREEKESATGDAARRRYVFGLPGNPVSSMVCFELFVRTAIRRLMGVTAARPAAVRATLAENHRATGDRPTYYPSHLVWIAPEPLVRPLPWQGSSDLCGTVDANAMVLFPAGERMYRKGDTVEVFVWGSVHPSPSAC